jgi:hypothetical protein
MTMSDEKYAEFSKAAEPLMTWLRDNAHPHVVAIVAADSAELFEGVARHISPDVTSEK